MTFLYFLTKIKIQYPSLIKCLWLSQHPNKTKREQNIRHCILVKKTCHNFKIIAIIRIYKKKHIVLSCHFTRTVFLASILNHDHMYDSTNYNNLSQNIRHCILVKKTFHWQKQIHIFQYFKKTLFNIECHWC
jgi:hypothetical protein